MREPRRRRPTTAPSLVIMLAGLPGDARKRFEQLHARCVEMRHLAVGVRGAAGREVGSAEEIRTPGLDRLLWLFLRLLMSKTALDRFLQDDEQRRGRPLASSSCARIWPLHSRRTTTGS